MRTKICELLPPCDPPGGLLPRVEAAVDKCVLASPEATAEPPRRTGRIAAIAIGAVVLLGGGAFAAMQLRGMESAPSIEDAAPEIAAEPAPPPPPRAEPAEPPPAIEVAAQGPAAPTDPRIEKAMAHARKHRCEKAAKLFAKLLDESPAHLGTAATALAPCRGWLQKPRGNAKITALARLLGLPPAVAQKGRSKRRR